MTDILEGKHGVYNLDKREDCYAYLCREAGLNGQQLSMLERIYSTPAPVEVEDLLDHIISAANSVSIPSESNYLNELKSRLLAALSNTTPYLSGDVIVPVEKLEQDLEQYITLGSTGCRTIAEDVEFNRLHSKFLAAFRKAGE